jgi:hypothetical protein
MLKWVKYRSLLPINRKGLSIWGGLPINRVAITDDEIGGFRITIPAQRNIPMLLFLAIWLCGWAIGEVMVPIDALVGLTSGQGKMGGGEGLLLLLVWFPFWTVAGLVIMFALWWNLAGREVVILSDGALVVRREVGSLQRSRSFDLAGVRNLRYAPLVYNFFSMSGSWGYQLQILGVGGGTVAFDHGGKTHRFGIGLSEIEANRLVTTIKQSYKIADDGVEPLPVSK